MHVVSKSLSQDEAISSKEYIYVVTELIVEILLIFIFLINHAVSTSLLLIARVCIQIQNWSSHSYNGTYSNKKFFSQAQLYSYTAVCTAIISNN